MTPIIRHLLLRACRFPGNALLAVAALLALRMLLHQSVHFGFLVWNIFLALLPLLCAQAATRSQGRLRKAAFTAAWLALFPNAAYLVTDIIHLETDSGHRFWLDLVLLFSAAALGVALSLRSVAEIERCYTGFLPEPSLRLLVLGALILSGYGIYLGRVERWNSWDPLLQPVALLRDIFNDFRHPFRNRQAWELTALFAAMQLGSYYFTRGRLSGK